MSELKEDAAKVSDTVQAATGDAAQAAAGKAVELTHRALGVASVRRAIRAVKHHPLSVVAVIGAAAALIEVELAVGILTGIGATALLATGSGSQTRQEVVTRGKWALERACALAGHVKSQAAEVASAATDQLPVNPV